MRPTLLIKTSIELPVIRIARVVWENHQLVHQVESKRKLKKSTLCLKSSKWMKKMSCRKLWSSPWKKIVEREILTTRF